MTTEELLFALAPDARAVAAAREVLAGRPFTALKRSADGEWLSAKCRGSSLYTVTAHRGPEGFRSECDCGSHKYPCKHAIALAAWQHEHPGDFKEGKPSTTAMRGVKAMPAKVLPAPVAAPTSAGEALLQAVWDDPDDAAAALIYADWLSEHGGPDEQDHADFIRVQVRLAESDDPALKKQEKALLSKHRRKWLKDVPTGLKQKVLFKGGFVRQVKITAAKLALVGPELGSRYPITEIQFEGNFPRKSVAALAVLDFWKRIRVLEMPFAAREDRTAFALFFRNIHLSNVRELDLGHLALTERENTAMTTVIATWPGLASVRSLSMQGNSLTARCVEMLCGSPHLGPLRRLNLRGNVLFSAGASVLASCRKLAGLEELDLGCNGIGPVGLRALARSPHMTNLKKLDLGLDPVKDAGALAALEGFPGLTTLSIGRNEVKPDTVARLRARYGEGLHLN